MYRCLILLFSVSLFPFSPPQLSVGAFCSVIASFHFQCWTRCPRSCPKFVVFLKHLCPWGNGESIKSYSSPVSWIYEEPFEGVVSRVGSRVMCFASSLMSLQGLPWSQAVENMCEKAMKAAHWCAGLVRSHALEGVPQLYQLMCFQAHPCTADMFGFENA